MPHEGRNNNIQSLANKQQMMDTDTERHKEAKEEDKEEGRKSRT